MEMLRKGQDATVLVEEALEDLVVVSLKVGGRTLRGVLLDAEKRLAAAERDVGIVRLSNSDVSTPRQTVESNSLLQWNDRQQQTRRPKLLSPVTLYRPSVQKRKRPQPVALSPDQPALKRQYRYVEDNINKQKDHPYAHRSRRIPARSVSPPRILGATPRRGRPPRRNRGRLTSKSKEGSAVYSRHYQPLVHSGASSSLRTAVMGSLELEKEMKHKPANSSGTTGNNGLDTRTGSKQVSPGTENLPQSSVAPGFYAVSGDFTIRDGKVFTQTGKAAKADEASSGIATTHTWLKLEGQGLRPISNVTVQPGTALPNFGFTSNSVPLATSGQATRLVLTCPSAPGSSALVIGKTKTAAPRGPEIRMSFNKTSAGGQPVSTIQSKAPSTDSPPKSSPNKEGESKQVEPKHHRPQSIAIVSDKRQEETKPGPAVHEKPAHYEAIPRLKIKRENITSPVWISESILTEKTPSKNPVTSQKLPEKSTLHKHDRHKNSPSKWPVSHQDDRTDPADQTASDETQAQVKPSSQERISSTTNHSEDSAALFEALWISKQEQKSNNQLDKSKPTSSQSDKQATKSRRSDLFYAPRPSNKRSQLVDQGSPPFNIYDIVWAKMVDRPWWPARVLSYGPSEGSVMPQTMLSASVKWLGRPTTCTSILPSSLLVPFVEGFDKNYDKVSTKSTYVRAIREALEIMGFNPDDPMAFHDYCKKLTEPASDTDAAAEASPEADSTSDPNTARAQSTIPDNTPTPLIQAET